MSKIKEYINSLSSVKLEELNDWLNRDKEVMYSEEEVLNIVNAIDDAYRQYTTNNVLGDELFNKLKKQ